jgi:hypothetical protein
MRFMVIVKATAESEREVVPEDQEAMAAMGRFNEELVKAGVMLAGEGLHPSSKGVRLSFGAGGKRTVVDGPFAETKELVGSILIIEAKDLSDAVRVASLHPAAHLGEYLGWWIEVRTIADGCHQ